MQKSKLKVKSQKLPTGWRKVKLGEIADIKTGTTDVKDAIKHGKYPLFDRSLEIKRSNKYLFDDTAIILPGEGRDFVPRFYSGKFDLHQRAYAIFPHKKEVDPQYLYYAIWKVRGIFSQWAVGSTVKSLRMPIIKSVPVALPSLEIQKRIAEILSAFDEKIEVNNKINQTLEQIASAIFKEWFVKFRFPRHKKSKFVDSELGKIPEEWEVKMLPEVFDFLEGPGIRNWQYTSKGCPFINIRLIQNNDIDVKSANFLSEEEANGKYKHFHLQERDMVVSTSGTLGRSAIVRKEHLPLLLNTSVIRFRPKDKQSYAFMYQFLNSAYFQNKILNMASGSAQPNFGPVHLKQIEVLVPDQNVLNMFSNAANPIYERIIANMSENQTLTSLRDLLLPKLMSGEVRV